MVNTKPKLTRGHHLGSTRVKSNYALIVTVIMVLAQAPHFAGEGELSSIYDRNSIDKSDWSVKASGYLENRS